MGTVEQHIPRIMVLIKIWLERQQTLNKLIRVIP